VPCPESVPGDSVAVLLAAANPDDRLVVDAIPAQVWRAAPDGAIQLVNQQWLDYTGLSSQQSEGWDWISSDLIHPADLPRFLDVWRRVLASGDPGEAEARVRSVNGQYRWFLIRTVPIRDDLGAITGWYGTNTDIEDRMRAEALLGEENRLLEMLAQGDSLEAVLGELCRMVEAIFQDSFVSIMLLNREQNRLWYAASGSLPPAYTSTFNGLLVGPAQGSCAEAAYRNEPAIVPDIAADPSWVQHRDIAAAIGVRACWSTPIRFSNGQVAGTFAIASRQPGVPTAHHQRVIAEVTHVASVAIAHARNASALQRSETYLAEAQRLSRTGSFGWNVSTGELFWSKETFSILDYPEDTKPTLDLVYQRVHPDDLSLVQQTVDRAGRDGGHLNFEHRLKLPDGTVKYLHVVAHAEKGESGTAEFVGAVSDITAAKRAEEQLRRSEAELRQIVDAIPQLIVAMSPVGQVLYANEKVLESTGLTITDVMAEDFRARLFHPDDLERLRQQRQHGMTEGVPFELEMRARMKDGVYRWYVVHYKPVLDDQGRIRRWYATGTDINERKLAEDQLKNENLALREEIDRASMFEEIVGSSEAVRTVLRQIAQVAPTNSTALITGETGTGKELVARAIHRRSARSGRAFISVNCAAVPSSLIASELFGHERGAFTGALQRRQGKFELADGGTIFLDEVGELPAEAQVALLRVLQEREFERIGGSRPIRVDVRVIAATNRDLQAAVSEKTFRRDLFYRLNVFPLEVPPLRERPADIPLLVEYFVHRFAKRAGKKIVGISSKTLDLLQSYPWPGNIRELQNVLERAVIVADGERLSIDARWLAGAPAGLPGAVKPLEDELVARERAIVEAALKESKGRVSGPAGAAAKLGIPRSTLESKIRSLGLKKNRFKDN
jgi:PAS domain S-box-containing protein